MASKRMFTLLLYFWNLPLFYHSINPRDYGRVPQMLKGSQIATSFIFAVLVLGATQSSKII